ncbi:MAG: hypothetical protein JSU87_05360 [Gemmatimonadota bacterium]|nr:MAG: hypothetical protein JSU87_05360 [Gemmatimonadota bacterium]
MTSENGATGYVSARLRDQGGFALALAVFALVLLAAVVAGGYFSASQEFQIGRGMRSMTSSFYAAEAGIREVLDDWNPLTYGALEAGDSMLIGPMTFEGGGSYTAKIKRVGITADSVKRYFYIETAGRPPGAGLGERRQAVIARVRYPNICCNAAVVAFESVRFGGGGSRTVEGMNVSPSGWPASACAGFPTDDAPGVIVQAVDSIFGFDQPNMITGSPAKIVAFPSMTFNGIFNFGDLSYNDLVALADHTFAGEVILSDSEPTVDANGRCDRSNNRNWGAPDSPGHPCFNYFPILHFMSDVDLRGSGSAQGILLVDDDLFIRGSFDFYGIAIVKDDIVMSGPSDLWGGVILGDDLQLSGGPSHLRLSRCVTERAERFSNLSRPRLISPRAWIELF